MDVRLPDGTILRNVPEGTTKAQIQAKLAGQHGIPELPATAGTDLPPEPGAQSAPQPAQQEDGLLDNTLDVLGEIAASANRTVTGFVDLVGPDTVNAILRLAGSDKQVPTLTGALESTGIQGGFMEPGKARDVAQTAGNAVTAAGGMVPVTRNAATLGNAVADFAGIGSSRAVAAAGGRTAVEGMLKNNQLPTDLAGVKLGEGGAIVADKAAKASAKQGFDEGFVAMVKNSTRQTRKEMSAMLDIVEKGKQDFRARQITRPLDVAGQAVGDRIKIALEANKAAGSRLDDVAKSLVGAQVDHSPAINRFLTKLADMGMEFDPSTRKLNLVMGSETQDMPKVHKQAKEVLERLYKTKDPANPDAHDLHVMKKWIDNKVNYGKKRGKPMMDKLENAVKALRHDLDGILDTNFPGYDQVNRQYSETIGALNALQDVAGKKMNFAGENADKALGTLTKRLTGNQTASRVPLMDAIKQLDEVAKKYAGGQGRDLVPYTGILSRANVNPRRLDNDVHTLVEFASQLDDVFRPAARGSFHGEIERGIRTAVGGERGAIIEGGIAVMKKMQGVNEKNAMKAMRELLRE